MKPLCAVCGRPYHRFSTSDPQHKWDGVACVNGLLHEIKSYRAVLTEIAESRASSWRPKTVARQALARFEEDPA